MINQLFPILKKDLLEIFYHKKSVFMMILFSVLGIVFSILLFSSILSDRVFSSEYLLEAQYLLEFFPYILFIQIVFGASAASQLGYHLFLGEIIRKTYEPLLVTPIKQSYLNLSKIIASSLPALIINLTSLTIFIVYVKMNCPDEWIGFILPLRKIVFLYCFTFVLNIFLPSQVALLSVFFNSYLSCGLASVLYIGIIYVPLAFSFLKIYYSSYLYLIFRTNHICFLAN